MFSPAECRSEDPSPQLNTTPLIDVMLVLLVMLMVTLPVMTHSIPLDVAVGHKTVEEKPPVATIEIEFDGTVYWDNDRVGLADIARRTQSILLQSDHAEFHVRPARLVRFEFVAKTLAAMERNGARRIHFLGNERYL